MKRLILNWVFRAEGGCPTDYAEEIIANKEVFMYLLDALDYTLWVRFNWSPFTKYLSNWR